MVSDLHRPLLLAGNWENTMQTRDFLKWVGSSLLGHIALSELLFSMPLFLLGLSLNYSEGTITVAWSFYIAIVCALGGIIFALLFWYTVSVPLIKRRKDKF